MNIKKAKEEIKNTILAYLSKDNHGQYKIPVTNQRPILLMGPPGIGKTAIMEQIAAECKIGLVAYTITHHTRQSAIGLPYITKKNYDGKELSVTEYTMSEIIASVYNKMEETNLREGILFIDEINCVSETLSATMLQFLKEKAFGNHKVPEGWIIISAGNPPEYNKSVREFDIVTLDRIRQINITEDYKAWKEYAYKEHVHEAIITYLDIKKEHFYNIETKVDGKEFVTARGWEDLSKIIVTYEELGLSITEDLVGQYIKHRRIAKDFHTYYDFYNKYKFEYSIDSIIEGRLMKEKYTTLANAPFDERITVIGLILSKLYEVFVKVQNKDMYISELFDTLKILKTSLFSGDLETSLEDMLNQIIEEKHSQIAQLRISSHLDKKVETSMLSVCDSINSYRIKLKEEKITEHEKAFEVIKAMFEEEVKERLELIELAVASLKNGFIFMEEIFGESQEMVIFITELTMNYFSSKFIGEYGSEEYYKYNKELMFKDKHKEIKGELDQILNKL